jgi:hypothetical protein
MLKSRLMTIILVALILLAGCGDDREKVHSPDKTSDTIKVAFQDLVSPYPSYQGTRDAVIKEAPGMRLHNFGNNPIDTIGTVEESGDYYQKRLILRMDLTSISSCSFVMDAFLHLSLEEGGLGSPQFELYRVTVPDGILPDSWMEGTGGFNKGVSWLFADDAVGWTNEGGDYIPIPLDTSTVQSDTTLTFSIPGPIISHWINNPEENHGFIIIPLSSDSPSYRIIHLRESPVPEKRPLMQFVYLEAG